MLKKIADNLGFAGGLILLLGLIHYSYYDEWRTLNQVLVYVGLGLMALYVVFKLPALIAALGTRGGKQGATAGVGLLLVLGILVLLNFLNYRHHERWDFSEGSLNSLSEQSIKVLQNLNGEVEVIGFFESKGAAQEFEDVLSEYRFVSSQVQYEVVDPQKDPGRIVEFQIERPNQVVIRSGAKIQKIDGFDEQKITNAIIKVTRDKEKVVYFLTGHGEHNLNGNDEEGYLAIRGAVERQNYKVQPLSLAVEGKLPEDSALLIAAGPKTNFLPNETQLIDQYLADAGKFLLMVDPQSQFQMNDWLGKYGIAFSDDVVIDNSGLGRLLGLGAAAPVVSVYSKHPIVEKLEVTTFYPFARSVKTVESSLGYKTQNLFSSSPRSWGEKELVEGARVSFDEGVDEEGPLPMAVVSVLDHEDQSAGGDVPEEKDEESKIQTRIVAVGDSDFASNRFLEIGGGHADLFLNMVSWLVQDEDLIAVRPRDPTDRKVTLTDRDASLLFWASVILLPLATLVFGIGVWWRRR